MLARGLHKNPVVQWKEVFRPFVCRRLCHRGNPRRITFVAQHEISMDWSDHALWWPSKNIWLTRTRSTLDQYGVQADALLHFTPMHKNLRVQLPDLRYLDMKVDFSVKTFSAVIHLCKDLGLRHPEELSLCKPLEPYHLKYNYKDMPKKKVENGTAKNGHPNLPPDTNTFIANSSPDGSTGSLDKSTFMCAPVTPSKPPPSSTPVSSPVGNVMIRLNAPDLPRGVHDRATFKCGYLAL
jgi:kindlin 2